MLIEKQRSYGQSKRSWKGLQERRKKRSRGVAKRWVVIINQRKKHPLLKSRNPTWEELKKERLKEKKRKNPKKKRERRRNLMKHSSSIKNNLLN